MSPVHSQPSCSTSAVAFGFALAMFVFKDYFPAEHFTSLDADLAWLQVLAAATGTLGFAILFNSRPRRLFLGALGGGLTWLVYLLLSGGVSSDFLCVALAAAFGAAYAEIMARVCKAPATVFTILSESGESDPAVEALIQARQDAKKAKNFAEADRIRDELKAQGVEITDIPGGAKWKRI